MEWGDWANNMLGQYNGGNWPSMSPTQPGTTGSNTTYSGAPVSNNNGAGVSPYNSNLGGSSAPISSGYPPVTNPYSNAGFPPGFGSLATQLSNPTANIQSVSFPQNSNNGPVGFGSLGDVQQQWNPYSNPGSSYSNNNNNNTTQLSNKQWQGYTNPFASGAGFRQF